MMVSVWEWESLLNKARDQPYGTQRELDFYFYRRILRANEKGWMKWMCKVWEGLILRIRSSR